MDYIFETYERNAEIPDNWNSVIGTNNILLSKEYFAVLENSAPANMRCFYIGFFERNILIGGALFQYLNFEDHQVLQPKKFANHLRKLITKNFSKNVLILGNNMLTGENGFYFAPDFISKKESMIILNKALEKMYHHLNKPSVVILKDYSISTISYFKIEKFKSYFEFSVQPNMALRIKSTWTSYEKYIADFTPKYRKREKIARKKNQHVLRKELDLSSIRHYQLKLNELYRVVAGNAAINTFFLAEYHFETLKFHLQENFKVVGYFLNGELVGFYSIILNNQKVESYFLGYDKIVQKELQLYLNMLFDMAAFTIQNNFEMIQFGRTALEIKSTIGAEPEKLLGLIKHRNPFINLFMKNIFPYVEAKNDWIQRNPFK